VLPSVAAALGAPVRGPAVIALPAARSAVVVLVDGLGEHLLTRRGGHAPFLRHLRQGAATSTVVTSGFPSTTATSMGMFGTGRLPGSHGLVGLDVLDPSRDVLFNELAWDPDVDPRRWQPGSTVFEDVAEAGLEVVRIGPAYFDGSGLTEAALRGGRFVAAGTLERRVDAAVAAVAGADRAGRSALVYLYWGELDKAGHVHGCESWQWGEELSALDGELGRLVRRLPASTLVAVTADHGMVDVPHADRLDVAREPDLAAGVRHVGGEARALHLYCEPGAAPEVLARWQDRLGDSMEIRRREDAVREGWFGPVDPHVMPRIGDVLASATGRVAVVDSRTARPEVLRLVGLHGARTRDERLVPLLATLGTRR
jgi:hypothetical protein